MKIVFWNIRGLKRLNAKDKLKSLVHSSCPSVVFVAEPKVRATSDFCKKLNLPNMHHKVIHNSTNTKKGNIWMSWNVNISAPKFFSITAQSITVEVGGCLVTGIHAACLTVDRRELWEELEFLNSQDKPWIAIGDFNTIMSVNEKKGGRSPLTISMQEFNDCLNTCGLIQAPKSGVEFSWCNNRAGTKRIMCNLDRAVYNAKWLEKYPGWSYKVNARGTSDHSALLGANAVMPKPDNVPFRALKAWLTHPYFLKLIKETWEYNLIGNPVFIFLSKLKRVKQIVKDWNWNDVRAQLQKAEKEVIKATLISDNQPENTKRQSHNAITELENSAGSIISTEQEISETLVEHFENKFKKQEVNFAEGIFDNIPKIINEEDKNMLNVIPTRKEIYTAVKEMDPDSAPGPDGFAGWFYTSTWDIIGDDLTLAIQFCWSRGFIPKVMNANFLTLLPKVQGAKKASQFRPIGMSNFCFNIFKKIITTRIGGVIEKIVSPQQGAFIKGRNIQNQIVLASELINEMETTRRGWNVGLKLDITQAYDSLSWDFLFQAMYTFGFSAKFIQWLLVLFQSTRISVMVNGGPGGFFPIGRGLKQGDPLSPILFIIAQEILSRKLTQMVQEKKLIPMVTRNGILPSHIFFADDIFLFFNGDKINIGNLVKLLKDYQQSSGQIVSMEKSKCFVGGTSEARKNQIAEYFGMSLSKFPDKYLGVNLVPGKIKSSHVWECVEALQSKMPGWMGKMLSFQERLILVKHVLCSIPIYNMSVYKWLRKVLSACDRIIRNSLWSGDPSKKKLLTVKWEEINAPFAEEGLGLRILKDINKSLLMKLTWKMQNDEDEWAKFFQAKFQDKHGEWINYYKKSSIWIGIKWVLDEVFINSRWIVGDGKNISVQDLLANGEWVIPAELSNMINVEELPVVDGQKDRKIWIWSKTGEFTVATAVELAGWNFFILYPISFDEVFSMAKSKSPAVKEIWMSAALITIKELCFHRNRVVYDGFQPNEEEVKSRIFHFTKECEVRMKGCMWNTIEDLQILNFFGMKCRTVKNSRIQQCFFSLPIDDKILLCCDGASRNNPGEAGYGFIGRDNTGGCLIVVARGIGIATNYMAEFFAVINACEWAISKGFLQVCIRTDSASILNSLVTKRIPWYIQTRWNKIISTLVSCEFIHSYREVNFSADGLAKLGATLLRGEKRIFLHKPSFLGRLEQTNKAYYRFM
ncbi:uncharacterized protein LOC113294756 [Papaver somniferum]|uniref:uncharacterized protein LOC113294756 n=1 Tax=Papaver somniferum TaxID=3469 RepID=UPI000E6F8FB0|nr:uncharacterized protein LOC113294756 [Papaver somniferum]